MTGAVPPAAGAVAPLAAPEWLKRYYGVRALFSVV